jgi:hypothetical protein
LNLHSQGHAANFFWLEAGACVIRAEQASETSITRREKVFLDEVGRVAQPDWPSEFLSHFIFKLNYFIAN